MSNRGAAAHVSSFLNIAPLKVRWSEEKILAEARKRTKETFSPKSTQVMLESLLQEAGWTNVEFIDALCRDVVKKWSH